MKHTKFHFEDVAGVLEQAQFLILHGVLLLGAFYEKGQRYLDLLPTPRGAAPLAEFLIKTEQSKAVNTVCHRLWLASQNEENGSTLQTAFRLAAETLETYLKRVN